MKDEPRKIAVCNVTCHSGDLLNIKVGENIRTLERGRYMKLTLEELNSAEIEIIEQNGKYIGYPNLMILEPIRK